MPHTRGCLLLAPISKGTYARHLLPLNKEARSGSRDMNPQPQPWLGYALTIKIFPPAMVVAKHYWARYLSSQAHSVVIHVDNYQILTLYADLAARQGQFARSTKIDRTTSGLIPLSICYQITKIVNYISNQELIREQSHSVNWGYSNVVRHIIRVNSKYEITNYLTWMNAQVRWVERKGLTKFEDMICTKWSGASGCFPGKSYFCCVKAERSIGFLACGFFVWVGGDWI